MLERQIQIRIKANQQRVKECRNGKEIVNILIYIFRSSRSTLLLSCIFTKEVAWYLHGPVWGSRGWPNDSITLISYSYTTYYY